ncbi:MAG TPA: alkaline phosphatase D family protein, partial [Anaerolineales bacterium]|nr:alkaline phosphatase D family protein [Anaerolineales bacterium]
MKRPSTLLGPIVGGLSHNSANIWARADAPSTMHVWLATIADLKDAKHIGETDLFANEGFAGVVKLTKLKPEAQYHYAVSLHKTKPPHTKFHTFTTFPEPSTARSFSFLFGSCYLPEGKDGSLTFDEIHKHIEADYLRFGLFLGDQIYADDAEHNGLGKIAVTLDEYRSVYADAWSRPPIKRLLPDLPLFMILDDHEVEDDWHWDDTDRNLSSIPLHNQILRQFNRIPAEQRELTKERVRAALKAYYEHQAMHAPKQLSPLRVDDQGDHLLPPENEGTFAYTFTFGQAAFFVLDTRTMRVKKGKNLLLGEAQWKQLEDWFLNVKDTYPVKFLVSSGTVMYPFLLDIVRDRWSGFRSERERLFKFLAENEIEGVHILTGDLHTAHCVSAKIKCPSGRRIPLWEFCSSPFEQESKWVSTTYIPMLSRWIRKQKKHYHQPGRNFGIVHIDFDGPTPRVTFT